MEKLDCSKLSELTPYAPTGPGKYLMRCGGVVEVSKFREGWSCGITLASWHGSGSYMDGLKHPFDLVGPAPDVMPWEECEQLEGLLVHANKEYASLLEACEADKHARLKLVEECERLKTGIVQTAISCGLTPADSDTATHTLNRIIAKVRTLNVARSERAHDYELIKQQRDQYESELRAEQELNRKWRSDFDAMRDDYKQQIKQLEAERDEWKQYAECLKQAIERPRSEADIVTELHGKQIADLLQRVEKLEMKRTGRCGIDYQPQIVTMPQEIEPLPASPESASREGGSAMTQREQFEQFAEKNGYDTRKTDSGCFSNIAVDIAWAAWQAAQAAKDAEMAELRAKLAKCREFIQALEKWENSDIHIDISDIVHIWHEFKFSKEACWL